MSRAFQLIPTRTLAALLLLTTIFATSVSVYGQRRSGPQPPAQTVIFLVTPLEGRSAYVEPIVVINRGRYQDPPYLEPYREPFNSGYFRKDQTHSLLYGARRVGKITIEKPTERGCAEWGAARARRESTVEFKLALATNNARLGKQRTLRRAPTNSERQTAFNFARSILRRKRVSASLVATLKAEDLIATDLDGDGRAELVGNFYIGPTPSEGISDYSLLLLLEPQGAAGYRVGLARYYHNQEKYRQASGAQDDQYLDQLDLDGDGTDEILIRTGYWEAWSYSIYKKQRRGAWRRVYQGGGGGC